MHVRTDKLLLRGLDLRLRIVQALRATGDDREETQYDDSEAAETYQCAWC